MHPAFSVIFFTAISGCGYGLLFLLGLALAANPSTSGRNEALLVLVIGAVFAAAGLTSSLFHLGQPQRAWRALSKCRSPWLSSEGVAGLASFLPVVALAAALWRGGDASTLRAVGVLLAIAATATVWCTARIYSSLKTIRAWHNAYALPAYLLFALLGGAAWLWALLAMIGADDALVRRDLPIVTAVFAAGSALLKREHCRFVVTS